MQGTAGAGKTIAYTYIDSIVYIPSDKPGVETVG